MAESRGLPGKKLIIPATALVIVLLPVLAGRPETWSGALWLCALTAAAWLLDPLAFGGGFVGLAGATVAGLNWPTGLANSMPRPGMVWLTVVVVYAMRSDLQVRRKLGHREAILQVERNEQQEWRAFFDNSPAGIVTTDGDGRIILCNPAARKLFAYENPPRGQGIAQSLAALGSALRIDRKKNIFHTLTGCTGWRPNGEMFVADAWFFIGDTVCGDRLGAVVVDASERLQERATGGLRASMATSQIAMGAVLHEIRNMSAAAALMYANLAHSNNTDLGGNADFQALGGLLKALANLAAAELRPGDSSHGIVDLRAVLAQLRIIVDPWFLESEIIVSWDIARDLPQVWGEESGLLQIFLNLAQNSNRAMLASQEKHLTIDAKVENQWVVVEFCDTGSGIANPDDLFEPFRSGTAIKGLGLFVSRAIAHSFHGELKYTPVESGACFRVELLPLGEWQKIAHEYETGNAQDQTSPRG